MSDPDASPRPASYPVHLQSALDPHLSRWLWLVKWVLVIPHVVVLAFLWIAFLALSVVAFFAILFTGHYPRAIFDFNVGVLRWSWRVSYYAYECLGTDRYPPFTLADVPDYPARLDVEYPERLSRGLVLVKWWLLAIPHYIVLGFLVGGGTWFVQRSDDWQWSWGSGGLISLLVLIAGVILLFTGGYPHGLYDLVLGLNRWVYRVLGYAGLMTDQYPPFRLDLGGRDPDGIPAPPSTDRPVPAPRSALVGSTAATQTPPPTAGLPVAWTGGRIAAVVIGALMVFAAMGPLTAGAATLWADRSQRDTAGFLTSTQATFATDRRALATQSFDIGAAGPSWAYPRSVLGDVRLRFTATDPGRSLFVGIAPTSAVDTYLNGVDYTTVQDFSDRTPTYVQHNGTTPATGPTSNDFWAVSASGSGTQTVTWTPQDGQWTLVVMNADSSPAVSVRADIGGNVPALPWIAGALLAIGLALLIVGAILLVVPLHLASRTTAQNRAALPAEAPR